MTARQITVNGVRLTPETILKTREHFAEIDRRCIEGALSGAFHVNDVASYVRWQEEMRDNMLAGKSDHTLTFLQRALWIQTGQSVPLLA